MHFLLLRYTVLVVPVLYLRCPSSSEFHLICIPSFAWDTEPDALGANADMRGILKPQPPRMTARFSGVAFGR